MDTGDVPRGNDPRPGARRQRVDDSTAPTAMAEVPVARMASVSDQSMMRSNNAIIPTTESDKTEIQSLKETNIHLREHIQKQEHDNGLLQIEHAKKATEFHRVHNRYQQIREAHADVVSSNARLVKEKDDLHSEVAEYLHANGLLRIENARYQGTMVEQAKKILELEAGFATARVEFEAQKREQEVQLAALQERLREDMTKMVENKADHILGLELAAIPQSVQEEITNEIAHIKDGMRRYLAQELDTVYDEAMHRRTLGARSRPDQAASGPVPERAATTEPAAGGNQAPPRTTSHQGWDCYRPASARGDRGGGRGRGGRGGRGGFHDRRGAPANAPANAPRAPRSHRNGT